MRTFNLNGIEILSNRELATVKGGDGIPTPIIIVEEGIGASSVDKLSTLFIVPVQPKPAKKK